jgi:hypothetical protein
LFGFIFDSVIVRLVPHPDQGPAGTEEPPEAPADVTGGAKPRTCLKCSKLFPSAGPGNRICPPCSRDNARLRLSEPEVQRQRGAKRHNSIELPGDDSV